jgi:hypothetical protein
MKLLIGKQMNGKRGWLSALPFWGVLDQYLQHLTKFVAALTLLFGHKISQDQIDQLWSYVRINANDK